MIAVSDSAAPASAGEFFHHVVESVKNAFIEMGEELGAFLPKAVIAIILLAAGLILAKLLRAVLGGAFKRIKLDDALNKVGVGPLFAKMGVTSKPSVFIPKVIYWVFLLFMIKVAAEAAGITDISEIILAILAFSPKVLVAIIIMLVGFIVSDLVSNAVRRALENLGLDYAPTVGKVCFGFIFILFLTVALPQLEIETELLNATVKIILGGIAVALALSLGLGLKGLANNVVSGVYARDLYKVGTEIEYDGEEAKVAGVGPITTKLVRKDGGFIIIPNQALVNEKIRGRGNG